MFDSMGRGRCPSHYAPDTGGRSPCLISRSPNPPVIMADAIFIQRKKRLPSSKPGRRALQVTLEVVLLVELVVDCEVVVLLLVQGPLVC